MKLRRGAPCRARAARRRRGAAGPQHEGARRGGTAGNTRAPSRSPRGAGGCTHRCGRAPQLRPPRVGDAARGARQERPRMGRGASRSCARVPEHKALSPKPRRALPLKPKRFTSRALPAGSKRQACGYPQLPAKRGKEKKKRGGRGKKNPKQNPIPRFACTEGQLRLNSQALDALGASFSGTRCQHRSGSVKTAELLGILN